MTVETPRDDHRSLDSAPSSPRNWASWTAIGRAYGRHQLLLIATCAALVLAAIGDEAPGYDGPGPFIDLALAVMVALVRWRFVPLVVVAASAFFLVGGLATPGFASRLIQPDRVLDFTAGWLQMLSFAAAAICAAASVMYARRTTR